MISQNKKTHTHTKPSIAWEMDSSCAHEMNSQTLESMLACAKPRPADPQQEKKARPADAQSQKCPRCDSPNTKFCYYNNYSLSQPRYFCKSCRRYWTKGGTLRNVPIGGGCRRPTKRSSSTSSRRSQDHPTLPPPANLVLTNPFSSSSYDSNDLSLAFARLQKQGGSDDFSIFGSYSSNGPNQYLAGDHFLAQPLAQNMNYLEMGGVSGPAQEEMEGPHEGRVLWGFPWMQSSGGDGNWQGLLNSPLV